MVGSAHQGKFDAVVFDLLTALLDSWTVWNHAARSDSDGPRWRRAYLDLTYRCGAYRPYEDLVREAAIRAGLKPIVADALIIGWSDLRPWPEAPGILSILARRNVPLGVATNCSAALGAQAADNVGVRFSAVVTAEEVGFYKPRPEPYLTALARLGTAPFCNRTREVKRTGQILDAPFIGTPIFQLDEPLLPYPIGFPSVIGRGKSRGPVKSWTRPS